MTISEWTSLCDHLREQFNSTGDRQFIDQLRRIGGMTTVAAHRQHVQIALERGKPVPAEVKAHYPDL